ncbi:probable G-protein coupled receptor 62 [Neophocaena asiaeorientalis asiaeorientalis]|uniref:Probable G-protein coupled receptor 62 n=1 Tax=Neophocaena asiaeorientalis asiaeorientalis TaxID=1706337 RepID=A0A341BIP9_NEOAA|nr:probable G-protein coupled receptor 62 [Neophocaena asiaeorientalis asiaeorientalis]
MANATGLNAPEVAASMGLILAAVVEAAALLGNGALLVVVLRTPGLRDALYLVHLCVVDLLAAGSIMPLGLLAAPPPGLGRVRLGPAPCRLLGALSLLGPPPAPPPAPARCSVLAGGLEPFRPLWALLAFALPALLLLGAYGGIFLVARRAALRPPRPARGSRPRSDSLDSRLSILPPLRPRPPWGKAALAPALAVGQFAACWLPYGCACLAPAAQAAAVEGAVTWVAYSAFAAHPFLYGLLQRPVRRTLGRLARRALPRPPRACTSRAWHPRALLQHLHRPPEGPVLGPSEAPEQARDLAGRESLSMPEAT